MEEPTSVNYLLVSQQDMEWGTTVSTVGHQHISPHSPYPSTNHPSLYLFSTSQGRILNEYQIIYIIGGQGMFQSSHCRPVKVRSGQMILLFPGEWHTYSPDTETGWHEHWIGFNGSAMDHLVEKGFFVPSNPIYDIGFNEQIVQLYHQAASIAQEERPGFQQQLAGIVQMLLGFTFAQTRQGHGENHEEQLAVAKQYVLKHFHEDITPEDMAAKAGMSLSQFRHHFKAYTGFSPHSYIMHVRLNKSKELLVNTDMSSKEIAYTVGFNTPYYFSIHFKRVVGISPMDYRRMAHGDNSI